MWGAYIRPRGDVAEVLGPDTLLNAYRKKFVFAVTGGGSQWFVEAVLMPTVRANLAGNATRRASSPSA